MNQICLLRNGICSMPCRKNVSRNRDTPKCPINVQSCVVTWIGINTKRVPPQRTMEAGVYSECGGGLLVVCAPEAFCVDSAISSSVGNQSLY